MTRLEHLKAALGLAVPDPRRHLHLSIEAWTHNHYTGNLRLAAHQNVEIEVSVSVSHLDRVIPELAELFVGKIQCLRGWTGGAYTVDMQSAWASIEQVHATNIAIADALKKAEQAHFAVAA